MSFSGRPAAGAELDIPALQREIVEVNVKNGWREQNILFTEAMALLVSEMSEAVDAWRRWGLSDVTGRNEGPIEMGNPPEGPPKPEGVGSEFADIAIRLLDDCSLFDVWIDPGLHWLEHRQVPSSLAAAMRAMDRVSCKAEDAWDAGDRVGVARMFSVMWLQLLYFSRYYGVDLGFEIERKMAYNRTRGWKHGGKRSEKPGAAYAAAVAQYGKDDYPRVSGPWFDQFPPAPEGWESPQWCWRHWAPCPLLGGNGILAALLVMQETVAGSVDSHHAAAKMDPELGKMCCRLGDVKMYEVWRDCPPSGGLN